ncbi:MAG: hypothetical protein QOH25_2224 [Acidobacteriota bacterium]|jgi:hypothetical protein|nr:hypothetical protein [Acidobacteriota bacterium]
MRQRFSLSENFTDRCAVLRLSCALLLVLLGAESAVALPLDEYRSRLHQAATVLDELGPEDEETETPQSYFIRARAAFGKVRKLVPSDETVEWEGGRVRVNNSWLEEELKSYEQTQAGDVPERIGQRLTALEERLNELEEQNKSVATSKEQERARLEAILSREEYRDKPPEKSLWERFKEWFNSLFPDRNPLQPGQSSWLSLVAMILIFGLAAGVIAYVIWKFFPFGLAGGTRLKLEKNQARIVLGEHLAPDQTAADLLAEAEALARKGELRAAIRKGYIALLCELGDRKVLSLAQHKTNHDYLRAVREKRPLLKEMQKLTASFENHWYGFVPTTPNDWTTFRSGYQQTLKTASLLSDK